MLDDYVVMSEVTFRGPLGPAFPLTSWRLPVGEAWAIRGGSGAGKSLFVAALTGKLPRLTGSLRHPFLESQPRCADSVFGVLPQGTIAVASMEEHRALVAERPFHQLRWHGSLSSGSLSVEEFLSYAAVCRRNPYAASVDDAPMAAKFSAAQRREIARWRLEPLLDRPLLALSNGELHRLLVARALMLDPGLLIVDDPYAGLDVGTREFLTTTLSSLPSAGTGVLYAVARDEDVPSTVEWELELKASSVVYQGVRQSRPVAPATRVPRTTRAAPVQSETQAPLGQPSDRQPVVLEMRGVRVRQNGIMLLDSVNLRVCAGERWALVGPNGAGKSTLLSLALADNPQAYSNHLAVCGQRLGPGTSIWDIKRCVGWLSPELDAHYPGATRVIDAVASGFTSSLGAYTALGPVEHATAAEWLVRLGATLESDQTLGGLSRLERRLVLLARACVHSPRLLLLDEPCQGLDGQDRARFALALRSALSLLGAALVYVTHEADELPPDIDHVLQLQAGRAVT